MSSLFTMPALAAGDAQQGETLYRVYCTQCHGVTGKGDGINAADVSVQPRDHTDMQEMSARTDEDLFKAIISTSTVFNSPVMKVLSSALVNACKAIG